MKYIAVILIVAGALYFLIRDESPPENIIEYRVVPPPADQIDGLFSRRELKRLGCVPQPSAEAYEKKSHLLIGEVSSYALQSDRGCNITVINLAQVAIGDDPGLWAGIRAAASGISRGSGYEQNSREGNIGEYSEIIDFTEHGEHRGFAYAVQDKGIVYSLIILSDTLKPSVLLESIILERMSKFSI